MKQIGKIILFVFLIVLMLLTTIVQIPKILTNLLYGGMFIFSIIILVNGNKINKDIFTKKEEKNNQNSSL
ncbi:hypothetical protein V3471_14785 [Flavobacterium oreochromis]|uniref:hypothetical protein n=1 Tax=Flavobacterium oreochromis TaxID=2906078 RepID=UPI00385810E5